MKNYYPTLLLILGSCTLTAQVVNGYGNVTAINAPKTMLTISNVNETNDSFEDGEKIIVMQMQDNVIGSNTANTSTFGNLSSIASAGVYEIATISSHTEAAGVPVTITLTTALSNTYSNGANSSIQVITFRRLGSPNYTTTANITALDWNGTIGGIVAIEVLGTFTLAHNITANGAGFRGGAVSTNYYPGGTTCDTAATTWRDNSNRRGEKGEGIYKRTSANYRYGKAKILNGGGGGVNINAGGGGGGGYTAGGNGYMGWSCAAGSTSGGNGGISLAPYYSGQRIFMGGGGGGGQQNNSCSTAGGDGGGIVIIHANTLATTGGCGGRIISANGNAASNSCNDGAGGGGGGGTITMYINTYSIAAGCLLTIAANGGDGGDCTNGSVHAGGGGGGQGAVIYGAAMPTTNITTQSNNGIGGFSSSANNPATQASSGSGSNGSGIIANSTGPLPIELLKFEGKQKENVVILSWITQTEINNNFFTLEKSNDAVSFESFAQIDGAGNSNSIIDYTYTDINPYKSINYYRLKQTDFNGSSSYSQIIEVELVEKEKTLVVYPNPSSQNSMFNLVINGMESSTVRLSLCNYAGKELESYNLSVVNNHFGIEIYTISTLHNGVYFIQIDNGKEKYTEKLVILGN